MHYLALIGRVGFEVRRIGSIQPQLGALPSSGAAMSTSADVRLVTESPIFSMGKITIRYFSLSHRSYIEFRSRREFRIDSMDLIIVGVRRNPKKNVKNP
jgi:hypothetical protein